MGVVTRHNQAHKDKIKMTRTKDKELMAKVAVLKAQGKNQIEIGHTLGITRQTVASYIHSPELQELFTQVQGQLVDLVQLSIERVTQDLKDPNSKYATAQAVKIVNRLGNSVLTQAPKVTQDKELYISDPQRRIALLKEIKELTIEEDKVTEDNSIYTKPIVESNNKEIVDSTNALLTNANANIITILPDNKSLILSNITDKRGESITLEADTSMADNSIIVSPQNDNDITNWLDNNQNSLYGAGT